MLTGDRERFIVNYESIAVTC